jgi:hypothetical protein
MVWGQASQAMLSNFVLYCSFSECLDGGVAHWNVLFKRYSQDWEVEMVMSFFEQLYPIRIRLGEVVRVVWNLSKRRNFEVKTFYKALVCHNATSFPWKGIWSVKAPKRMALFV